MSILVSQLCTVQKRIFIVILNRKNLIISNKSIQHFDGAQTPYGQREPGSNDNKKVIPTPKYLKWNLNVNQ